MIGVQSDRAYLEEIQKGYQWKTHLAAGLLSLPQLAAGLKQYRLFIGGDPDPAHIVVAVGVPVVSLFSGTNRASQWDPWGLPGDGPPGEDGVLALRVAGMPF